MVTFIAVVFVFGLLVSVHEIGHLIFAKLTGMRVSEFALGFGPAIIKFQWGETRYVIRILPLGGYNKIEGMSADEELDDRSFVNKPLLSRLVVILAGSVMNLLLPILLFATAFYFGGIEKPSSQPVIGEVVVGHAAQIAGFQAGDYVQSINGQHINDWQQFVDKIRVNAGQQLSVELERNGQNFVVAVTPVYDEKLNRGIIGVAPQLLVESIGITDSVKMSVVLTGEVIRDMVLGIYGMIFGTTPADISGPVGIIKMTGDVAHQGLLQLLRFAAFLSINLGIINLLPLPLLDGGHVVMIIIEAIRRKPLPPVSIKYIQIVGIAMLLALMIFATAKDINRMF